MTYEEAVDHVARELAEFIAEERRQPATVTAIHETQPEQQQKPRRRRADKAA